MATGILHIQAFAARQSSPVEGVTVNITGDGFTAVRTTDAEGNLANWIIPGKKMPGMGGAMDLCVGAKHCIVCMEHTAKGNPKIFEKCRLPLTASHCVNKIITEMCVFEVTENGLLMTEINPEFTVDQIKEATAAPFEVAVDLKSMLD